MTWCAAFQEGVQTGVIDSLTLPDSLNKRVLVACLELSLSLEDGPSLQVPLAYKEN